MSFKEKVYRKLSPKLQDFALTIAGLEINKTRYSKTFFKYLKDFQSSYRFSRKETLDLNEQRFQELLRNIKENKNSLLRFNFLYPSKAEEIRCGGPGYEKGIGQGG